MKKINILCFLFFAIILSVNAQKKVDSYYNEYFEKDFDILVAEDEKKEEYTLYLGVSAEREHREAVISIKSKDLKKSRETLIQIKEKFIEWSKIAKENNVTDMTKSMDYSLSRVTVAWYGSKWFFAFNQTLRPTFSILKDGRHIIFFTKKVTASSNEYIDEEIYWAFLTPEEIDIIISWLDAGKIKKLMDSEKNKKDLFQ